MRSNLEDAGNEKCDHCGLGFKPDELMNFTGKSAAEIREALQVHMTARELHRGLPLVRRLKPVGNSE